MASTDPICAPMKGADHREVRLYGQEVNLTTSAIARMNLSFHRAVQSEVRRGDTLREPVAKAVVRADDQARGTVVDCHVE